MAAQILGSAGAFAGPWEDGMAAYNRGDYVPAIRLFRPLAEQGNARAQHLLGVMYRRGQGVARNPVRAFAWFSLAAARGDAQAKTKLHEVSKTMTPRGTSRRATWRRPARPRITAVASIDARRHSVAAVPGPRTCNAFRTEGKCPNLTFSYSVGATMRFRVRKSAHFLERIGLAMAGAACGLFVAAHVGSRIGMLTSQGFIVVMMIAGAIGFYLGIDTPPLPFHERNGGPEPSDEKIRHRENSSPP